MDATELVLAAARDNAAHPALIEGEGASRREHSFSELANRVEAGAGHLMDRGLKPGETVLAWTPVGFDLCVAVLAAMRAGLLVSLPGPAGGREHLQACLESLPARGMLGYGRVPALRWLWRCLRRIPIAVRLPLPVGSAETSAGFSLPSDHPAIATFHIPEHGLPRPQVRTHGFLRAALPAFARVLQVEKGERDLPLIAGLTLVNLAAGACSVLPAADVRLSKGPSIVSAQLFREQANRLTGKPGQLDRLARHALARASLFLGLRTVVAVGDALLPGPADRLRRAAPKARILAVHGGLETGALACLDLATVSSGDRVMTHRGAGLLAGTPCPGTDLRILHFTEGGLPVLDETSFNALESPRGLPGEIVVAGEPVFGGATRAVAEGTGRILVGNRIWHRTGEAGTLDERGRLWRLGPAAARMPVGGKESLFPFAVECAVSDLAGLRSASLGFKGVRGVLEVELEPGAKRDEVERLIHARVPWARLERVVMRAPLPEPKS